VRIGKIDEIVHVVHREGDMMIVSWTVIEGAHPYDCYARIAIGLMYQSVEIMRAPDGLPDVVVADRLRSDSSVRGLREALKVA
jgi:hypothetical protein